MDKLQSLPELRDQIDQLDQELLLVINRRAGLAQEVARTKIAAGETGDFYRPDREAEVLRRIKSINEGPLDDETAARFFRELMSACLSLEKPLDVAFLGPEGTFTQEAALKHFGHAITTRPMVAIGDIFREVESGAAHYGVVPVENSTEGVIAHTLDSFLSSSLLICGEVELRIHHNLLSKNNNLTEIDEVFSHQQSLAQCREWLDTHLPNAKRTPVSSNAEAARIAANTKSGAAIAGKAASELYDLAVIEGNIEDEADNTTRFLIIGKQAPGETSDDKTTLIVSTENRPGALHELLEVLAKAGISMTKIESRPSRRTLWDYLFYIDIDGHQGSPLISEALSKLRKKSSTLKILGSYPRAVL
ncbi:MAG: prephenate dehydratase [Gammaproteobacteria bacterium]|nr:MAG: prephenate dehydratase [Gammaproteobacteria bacterium]RLA22911.1 MAG: prephenate dehydratase [Gammaproteobacteria bacterium]